MQDLVKQPPSCCPCSTSWKSHAKAATERSSSFLQKVCFQYLFWDIIKKQFLRYLQFFLDISSHLMFLKISGFRDIIENYAFDTCYFSWIFITSDVFEDFGFSGYNWKWCLRYLIFYLDILSHLIFLKISFFFGGGGDGLGLAMAKFAYLARFNTYLHLKKSYL